MTEPVFDARYCECDGCFGMHESWCPAEPQNAGTRNPTPEDMKVAAAAWERLRIVTELRFIEASDKSGTSSSPTMLAMAAKRWADDLEAGRPLRGSS